MGDNNGNGPPDAFFDNLRRLFEAQERSAAGDHALLLEIQPGPSDDTSWHAPSPRRCTSCGVYEPITALMREGDRGPGTSYGGEAEAAICADRWECARRQLHDVGGQRATARSSGPAR